MRTYYLIRHGQSEGNVDWRAYLSKPNILIDLTSYGVRQSVGVGLEILSRFDGNYEMIYSPFVRASRTAEIISAISPPVRKYSNDFLIEREWTLDFHSRVREPGVFDFDYKPEGMESFADMYERAKLFMASINPCMENVVVVGHGEMLRSLYMLLSGRDFSESPRLKNAVIYKVNDNR